MRFSITFGMHVVTSGREFFYIILHVKYVIIYGMEFYVVNCMYIKLSCIQ